tara:strand:+ start:415 stop:666 length:252 start_codon:yes stop_codon:yes gene_type:complete
MAQIGSTRRFGARYGRTIRKKVGVLEKASRATYTCPFCQYKKVKRHSVGIWNCGKCDKKFTSKAYSVSPFPTIKLTSREDILK